jgi:general secretion pathway protein K
MCPNLKAANNHKRQPRRADQQGAVLLLVLLVLMLISVLILSWAQEWRMELRLASNYREAGQCRRLAEGGVYYALGKLAATKIAEMSMNRGPDAAYAGPPRQDLWLGDQSTRELKLPEGLVAIRLEDEGGKINLNRAPGDLLMRLFAALGVSQNQIPTMVDSILDWRSKDEDPRPFGAKSNFYLRLEPPYVAKMAPFETVEELSWVHGFEGSQAISRLGEWLTVQSANLGVNINTAPREVLQASGLPLEVVSTIIAARRNMPFRSVQEIGQLAQMAQLDSSRQLTVQSSPFFTIKSTGMINKKGGRQTIKAIVRVDTNQSNPWQILSWVDDFSG